MEEALDVYLLPEDPEAPLICMDEASKHLVGETRTPLPLRPGDALHYDYEYVRNGAANLFMLFAPLLGWWHVEVTDHQCRVDWAHVMRDLADVHFPHARAIRVVLDNLTPQAQASLFRHPYCCAGHSSGV